jgi:hypothetical protein
METADNFFDPLLEVGCEPCIRVFQGEFTKIDLIQPDGSLPGDITNRVIDPEEPFKIHIEWKISGAYKGPFLSAVDDWKLKAFCESIGPGPEMEIGTGSLPIGPIAGPNSDMYWSFDVEVPAHTLPPLEDKKPVPPESNYKKPSGIYKIVVSVFANAHIPGPFDIVGFGELRFLIGVEDPN